MKNLSRILLSAVLVLSTTSCTAAEAEVCEMCGRAVCVCNGVVNPEEPKDPEENNGTEKPAPVPTGSNFVTLRNGRMTAPDGTEVRLWGVNFQTPITWEYNRLKQVGVSKTASGLNTVAENNLNDLKMMGVNHLRCHLAPSDLTDATGNLAEHSVFLDALDYMIAGAEARGMYVSFALINTMGQTGTGGVWVGEDRSAWVHNPETIECSRRYVSQLVKHVNKYNGKAYKDTECIAFWELINEPSMYSRSEIKSKACVSVYNDWLSANGKTDSDDAYAEFRTYTVKTYINDMMALLEEAGDQHLVCWGLNWHRYMRGNQDIFDGVSASDADLVAFCNYPGQDLAGQNYWERRYDFTTNDFSSWFKDYRNDETGYGWALTDKFASKGKVVYEFETFFNQSAYMYPIQATYFRSFGVQSASMWTYTFNEIAQYVGGSHYLNVRTTPGKMAAFLVAQQIFRNEDHLTGFSSSPNEQTGANYAISKARNGAVWSSADTFVHSCEINDGWNPLPPAETVKHIVGYKSSPLVSYTGTGLYFIDDEGDELKITLLPNVEVKGDIFTGATYGKEKTKLDTATKNEITINLADWKDAPLTLYKIDEDGNEKSMGKMTGLATLKLLPGKYIARRR